MVPKASDGQRRPRTNAEKRSDRIARLKTEATLLRKAKAIITQRLQQIELELEILGAVETGKGRA